MPPIPVTIILDVGGNAETTQNPRGADIYASVAIQVDDFYLMMVAYGDSNTNFVGIVSTRRATWLVLILYCPIL